MPRNMSFSMTTKQAREKSKTVTVLARRFEALDAGDMVDRIKQLLSKDGEQ